MRELVKQSQPGTSGRSGHMSGQLRWRRTAEELSTLRLDWAAPAKCQLVRIKEQVEAGREPS